MALPKTIQQYLSHPTTHLPPSKPLLRISLTLLTVLLLALALSKTFFPSSASYIPHFTSPDRIEYGHPPAKSNANAHPMQPPRYRYTPPQDLTLPQPPDVGLTAESRIGKISILFNGKDPLMNHAIRTHEPHNRRFGYPLLILRHGLLDGGTLDGIWNKPAYLLGILLEEMRKPAEDRLEWLFWHDADTILLNPYIPLSLFLPPTGPAPHIHLLCTADPHGLNNGVFLLRIHPWSVSLLTTLLAYPHFHPATPLPYRDQSAMALVLALPPFRAHHTYVPQRWFNAYAAELDDAWTHKFQVRRGDLLVHFAGCPVQERERAMAKWFERSEGRAEAGEWAVEVQKTSLPGEVERFWAEWVEKEEERRREREGVRRECDGVGRKAEGWLREFGEGVEEGERDKVWEGLKALKAKMEDEEVDTQGLKEGMEELMEVAKPLRLLVAEAKKQLIRDAHALIVEAERFLLDENIAREPEIALKLEEKVGQLRELLAREPDDRTALKKCTDELREVAQEFAVQADTENKDDVSKDGKSMEGDSKDSDGKEDDSKEGDSKEDDSTKSDSKEGGNKEGENKENVS